MRGQFSSKPVLLQVVSSFNHPKMSLFTASLFLAAVGFISSASAMDCSFGRSDNLIDKTLNSCPRPIIDNEDKHYCCMGSDGDFYCCEGANFAVFILICLLVILVPLALLCCIIGCIWRCICAPRSHHRVRRY